MLWKRLTAFATLLLAAAAAVIAPGAASAAHLYASGFTTPTKLAAYGADSGDGSLTQVVGSPYTVGAYANAISLTPDSNFLYLAGSGIEEFTRDADGHLTPLETFPTATSFNTPAVSPDGDTLFASTGLSNQVRVMTIAGDGTLDEIPGSPFAAGNATFGIAVTPSGKHLYAANVNDSTISAYTVAANGALTPKSGSPYATGNQPYNLAVTPDGTHLYVATAGTSDKVYGYNIAANGQLSSVTGASFATGNDPIGIAVTPDGKHLYTGNQGSGNVSGFTINANGSLTAAAGSPYTSAAGTRGLAITPDGSHLYASNYLDNSISGYGINPNGSLSAATGSPFPSVDFVSRLATAPDQSPSASFRAEARSLSVDFDATHSTDLEGPIARYDWDFGDGSTLPDGGPTPTHDYGTVATYPVTLTVTDQSGCSVLEIYTGQTAYCSGNPRATVTRDVTIDTGVKGAKLKAKKTQKQKGGKILIKAKAGAAEQVKISVSGKISVGSVHYPLKKTRKTGKAGKLLTLKLKPKNSSSAKKISQGLGGKVKANLQATFIDAAGNTAKKKAAVKLK